MNVDKYKHLQQDVHELKLNVQQLNLAVMTKDIDKAKALSIDIAGSATSIQVALSQESSL